MENDNSHDNDPLALELSQETLENSWHDLSEVLVLYGDNPEPLVGEFPPSPDGQWPYSFTRELPSIFVRDNLLSEKDDIAGKGTATYVMQHRIDPEGEPGGVPEVYETASVRWVSHLPNDRTEVDNRIVIKRTVRGTEPAQFEAYTFKEYSEPNESGEMMRVSPNAHNFPESAEVATEDDYLNSLEDLDISHDSVDIDSIDKLNRVTEYILANRRTS